MFEKIRSYLASELDISEDEITRDTTFESLGVELEIEEKIATVGELVDFVESKVD